MIWTPHRGKHGLKKAIDNESRQFLNKKNLAWLIKIFVASFNKP